MLLVITLIGMGIAIGVTICRKRTSNLTVNESLDDFTTPTYVSAQRIEPRIRYSADNRISQRTSLYMEEIRNGIKLVFIIIIGYVHAYANTNISRNIELFFTTIEIEDMYGNFYLGKKTFESYVFELSKFFFIVFQFS